jgi:hypothetical protein
MCGNSHAATHLTVRENGLQQAQEVALDSFVNSCQKGKNGAVVDMLQ